MLYDPIFRNVQIRHISTDRKTSSSQGMGEERMERVLMSMGFFLGCLKCSGVRKW